MAMGSHLTLKPLRASWQFKLAPPLVLAVIALACVLPIGAQKPAASPGIQIVSVQGYPELRVDGHPFFVHAAEFSYYRIPKDLWNRSLDRFRELGINTIDLRIPWNWHEIREGEFDFDGHTNPRRDLRGLLQMISEKGFYLIARPGPAASDEWKNDGVPDWIVASSSPPPYSPAWLAAVAHELAPYASAKSESASEAKSSGRVLFMILNGNPSSEIIAASNQAPSQSESGVRDALIQAGLNSHFLAIEPHTENGVNDEPGIPVASEWFMSHAGHSAVVDPKAGGARVNDGDAQSLAFIAQNLRMQTDFPAMLAGFQAGWPTPADETSPPRSSSSNTLLATRWLMAQGVTGIEYSPLQDSLTPPGFQSPASNRDFRWNAPLNLNGEKQEHAQAVSRNGKFLEMWGEFLASSHPLAGIGLLDWTSGLAHAERISREQEADAMRKSLPMFQRIERVALLAGLPVALVSPEKQSTEMLLHNSFLLLAIPDSLRGKPFLPPASQNALLEYVRAGGVLICNPERPTSDAFDQALAGAESRAAGDGFRVTKLGRGRIVEWSKDFYSWLDPAETFAHDFQQQESHFGISALQSAAQLANFHAPIVQSNENQFTLLINELVSNAAAGMLAGQKSDCDSHPACTTGLLSVTNWSGTEEIHQTLKFLPPNSDPRMASDADFVELPIDLPARESLMLPVSFPLCPHDAAANNCPDRIVAAGAELLAATREGKAIQLTLYAPTAATVLLHVRSAPVSADLPVMSPASPRLAPSRPVRPRSLGDPTEGLPLGPSGEPVLPIGDPSFPERILHGTYERSTGIFKVIVPRGAAPNFQRVLRLHLSYDPDLPEQKKPAKFRGKGYRYSVADAIRFPLNDGKSLVSDPPIILLDKDHNGQFLVEAQNLDDSTISLQASVSGAAQGSASLHMTDQESDIQTVKLRANGSVESGSGGLLTGTLTISGGHLPDRSSSIRFLIADSEAPVHYEYDFERSGFKNWVLENKRTRLILLPAAGGQISALVDKSSGTNLTTMSGGLRDLVRVHAPTGTPNRLFDPMLNVPYVAEWSSADKDVALQMKALWPKGSPISGDITKTIRMSAKDGADIIEAEYLLHGENKNPASVVSAFSVPASAEKSDGTQFCWTARALQPSADSAAPAAKTVPEHCTLFVAGGSDVEIPNEAARIEIRTPGRPSLAMEWDAGHLTLEQKQHSARILLEFPPFTSQTGAEDVRHVVRYIVVRAP